MKRKHRIKIQNDLARQESFSDYKRNQRLLCDNCRGLIDKPHLTTLEFDILSSCKCLNQQPKKKKRSFFRGFRK